MALAPSPVLPPFPVGDVPLAHLPESKLRPSKESLQKIMAANQQTAERLYGIVAKFTLDKENSPESTALKLVE